MRASFDVKLAGICTPVLPHSLTRGLVFMTRRTTRWIAAAAIVLVTGGSAAARDQAGQQPAPLASTGNPYVRDAKQPNDDEAARIVAATTPIYYITGTIHSPETGSPTALMELVYRLAVDESPYIQKIRNKVIALVTPIVEVDGRDRHVDVYRWHLANPD